MITRIKVYDDEIIFFDENGNRKSVKTDKPIQLEDRRGMPF